MFYVMMQEKLCELLRHMGMLHWGYGRVSPDGIDTSHITNGVKGVGECSHQYHYVLDLGGGTRESHLRQLHLVGRAEAVHKDGLMVHVTVAEGAFVL